MTMPAQPSAPAPSPPAETVPGAIDSDGSDKGTSQEPAAPKRSPVERRAAATKKLEESRAARASETAKGEPAEPEPKPEAKPPAAAPEPDALTKVRERMAAQRAERERETRAKQLEQERDAAKREAEEARQRAEGRRRELTAEDLRDAKRRREAGIDDRRLLDDLTHATLNPDAAAHEEALARLRREAEEKNEAADKRVAAIEQQIQAENERRFWEAENTAFLNSIKALDDAKDLPDDFLFKVGVDAIHEILHDGGTYDRQLVADLAAAKLQEFRKLFAAAPTPKPGSKQNSSPKSEADKQARAGSAPDASPRTLTADLETQSSGAPRKKPYADRKRDLIARMDREKLERQVRGEK